ncbi:S24 family peptidase [Mucilaginibacter pocheonensis]|uniref:Phage repressor protein C with HTH and peptisase S24 domain n=1 Tax=Mucilaginibacter pocheonensis TaxID=398050 RepID=A0ABU1TGZ4_9SPHI|nr:S24 family peptidase [Mucilaginibacter pocheonensis]MDR6944677.1 phage repressor protein C with HTH and peptisase S24 domain [Mucilaginibacter pocheonensis]
MDDTPKPNKIKTVRPETLEFIILYNQLKGKAFMGNAQLAEALGFNSPSSITEIVKSRQNIDPEKLRIFKEKYRDFITGKKQATTTENNTVNKTEEGIPMYEISATASGVEVYNDINDSMPVGRMNFPGIEDCDFALPVWGHSMYPYLENGCWVALKVIHDKKILPGEVYYIEWGEYRMYKRLLAGDNPDEVIAHSDNTTEMIGNRLKYAPFSIKIADIKKLCLVKDIHKKHNH